jgi:hypothetical protein
LLYFTGSISKDFKTGTDKTSELLLI